MKALKTDRERKKRNRKLWTLSPFMHRFCILYYELPFYLNPKDGNAAHNWEGESSLSFLLVILPKASSEASGD